MTQREAVLTLLHRGGTEGITTEVFLAASLPRFSAHILELRNAGYNIHRARISKGTCRYTLLSTPEGLAHTPRLPADTLPPVEIGAGQDVLFEEGT